MNQLSPGSGLWVADQLYRAGKSPLILSSGGKGFDSRHPPESAPAAILTEQQSRFRRTGLALKEYLGLLAYRLETGPNRSSSA